MRRVILLLVLVCGCSTAFSASVRYTYTSNEFEVVSSGMEDRSGNRLTFSFVLDTALPNNIPLATDYSNVFYGLNVLSFSVSDGVKTIIDTDPRTPLLYGQLSTDSDGNITEWDLRIDEDSIPYMEIGDFMMQTIYVPSANRGSYDRSNRCREYVSETSPTCYSDIAVSSDQLGLWTVTVVPIPAAVWLFGSALLGLGWMRRKA